MQEIYQKSKIEDDKYGRVMEDLH